MIKLKPLIMRGFNLISLINKMFHQAILTRTYTTLRDYIRRVNRD